MKLIRSLVAPWLLFFLVAVGALVFAVVKFPLVRPDSHPYALIALAIGCVLCIFANLGSLASVGIWIQEALPESLRFGTFSWLFRAAKWALIAFVFWLVGQYDGMPLIYHAAVEPVVYTIALFVIVANLLGPVLKWSANLSLGKLFSLVLSLPVFALVPLTALYIGKTVGTAYRESNAEFIVTDEHRAPADVSKVTIKGKLLSATDEKVRLAAEWSPGSAQEKTIEIEMTAIPPQVGADLPRVHTEKEIALTVAPGSVKETDDPPEARKRTDKELRAGMRSSDQQKRATALREAYERGKPCTDLSKEVQMAMHPEGNKDVVYWAVRDVECADVRPVIAITKLIDLFEKHPDAAVRGAAIRALKKFGDEKVRNVAYLLVKRLSSEQPPEVVSATAHVMASLDQKHRSWASGKLKGLLDSPTVGFLSARALVHDFDDPGPVAEYVEKSLPLGGDERKRAVSMICLLPQARRAVAAPFAGDVVATIEKPEPTDAGMRALDCLGRPGFDALQDEIKNPRRIEKSLSVAALAELDVKEYPEAVGLAENCVKDGDDRVRSACSRVLGEIGAPALPKIIELLQSGDDKAKAAGQNALNHFEDPKAKDELEKIVRANSGWMANSHKMQVARAAGTALARIDADTATKAPASSEPATAPSTSQGTTTQ